MLAEVLVDILHLLGPAPVVHAERFIAPRLRQRIEAGLGHDQSRTRGSRFQRERHERGLLMRVIHVRVHRVGVPVK